VRHHDPDLILLDYMMPGMDGLDFLSRFRAMPGQEMTPVIMITADMGLQVRHKALQMTANDFLSKPVNRVELLARVKNMLAMRKSQLAMSQKIEHLSEEVEQKAQQSTSLALNSWTCWRAAGYRTRNRRTPGAHVQLHPHHRRPSRLAQEEQDLLLSRRAHARHRQDGHPRPHPAQTRTAGRRRTEGHAPARPDRRRHPARQPVRCCRRPPGSPARTMRNGMAAAIPMRLKGEDIPLYGRIVAVADVFDALTSTRPYKKAGAWKTPPVICATMRAATSIRAAWRPSLPDGTKWSISTTATRTANDAHLH
jgi:putative two-component system response regulator